MSKAVTHLSPQEARRVAKTLKKKLEKLSDSEKRVSDLTLNEVQTLLAQSFGCNDWKHFTTPKQKEEWHPLLGAPDPLPDFLDLRPYNGPTDPVDLSYTCFVPAFYFTIMKKSMEKNEVERKHRVCEPGFRCEMLYRSARSLSRKDRLILTYLMWSSLNESGWKEPSDNIAFPIRVNILRELGDPPYPRSFEIIKDSLLRLKKAHISFSQPNGFASTSPIFLDVRFREKPWSVVSPLYNAPFLLELLAYPIAPKEITSETQAWLYELIMKVGQNSMVFEMPALCSLFGVTHNSRSVHNWKHAIEGLIDGGYLKSAHADIDMLRVEVAD